MIVTDRFQDWLMSRLKRMRRPCGIADVGDLVWQNVKGKTLKEIKWLLFSHLEHLVDRKKQSWDWWNEFEHVPGGGKKMGSENADGMEANLNELNGIVWNGERGDNWSCCDAARVERSIFCRQWTHWKRCYIGEWWLRGNHWPFEGWPFGAIAVCTWSFLFDCLRYICSQRGHVQSGRSRRSGRSGRSGCWPRFRCFVVTSHWSRWRAIAFSLCRINRPFWLLIESDRFD